MDIEEIVKRVADIDQCSWDDESAHGMEDRLRNEFIQHVADSSCGDISEMAREVLKTGDIRFARWCA